MTNDAAKQDAYRYVNEEMRQGLKRIYQEITNASSGDGISGISDRDELFNEASMQLNEIMEATEQATMKIMEITERHLDLQMESAELIEQAKKGALSPEDATRLSEINQQLGDDLTALLTSLSFQDITGQRIKKVVGALRQIEASVVDMYISSGLVMEGAERDPSRSITDLKGDAQKAMDAFRQSRAKVVAAAPMENALLKGPSSEGFSQSDIDDMLAQLGM